MLFHSLIDKTKNILKRQCVTKLKTLHSDRKSNSYDLSKVHKNEISPAVHLVASLPRCKTRVSGIVIQMEFRKVIKKMSTRNTCSLLV